MKALTVILFCLSMLVATVCLMYSAYNMDQAAKALIKASNDYRDASLRELSVTEVANYELGQIAKDRIRIREIMKRLEAKLNVRPDDAQPGGAKGNSSHAHR